MDEQHIYVGIDPSIASTGITVMVNNDVFFYNIKNKQTAKEKAALEALGCSNVILYEYENPNIYKKTDAHKFELIKTKNLISAADAVKDIIADVIATSETKVALHVCIEANAYAAGSRTTSLVELCGLNFLIRERILSLGGGKSGDFLHGTPQTGAMAYRAAETVVLICSAPSEIKKFATGRGDADKELMLYCFALLQPEFAEKFGFLKLDDIADSFFMCVYAKHAAKNNNVNSIIYNKEQQDRLNSKINTAREQKRENKITIKNMKNKKMMWDGTMLSFADQISGKIPNDN